MHSSLPISQHFLLVIAFVGVFIHLHSGLLSPESLIVLTGGSGLLAWIALELVSAARRPIEPGSIRRKAGSVISLLVLCLVLLAISPVLKTLTEATTDDSIWALSAVLFFLHLVLADYSSEAGQLQATLSVNAAVCASVVLASRLATDQHVFALVLFAVSVFAFAPILLRHLPRGASTLALLSFAVGMLSRSTAVLVGLCVVFVSGVCPAWMRWAQRWKNEIRGPWDPAEPLVSSGTASVFESGQGR